jgi:Septum formation
VEPPGPDAPPPTGPGYPTPGPPPGYQTPGLPPGTQPGWDGFAIAAFVFSVIGWVLLGIVLGVVGLVRTSGGQRRGRGLAIAALVISALWAAVIVTLIVIAVMSGADRDASGTVVDSGSQSINDVRVHDCLADASEGVEVSVTVVPCTQPHQAEVFAMYDLAGTDYPGEAAVFDSGEAGCRERLPDSLARSDLAADLRIFLYYPRQVNWMPATGRSSALP